MADEVNHLKEQTNDMMSVVTALKKMSCCERCILRLLGERDIYLYQEPVKAMKDVLNRKFDGPKESSGTETECNNSSQSHINSTNSCTLCLGILERSQESVYIKEIQSSVEEAGYEFDNFMFTISLPHSIVLRQHLILTFLQEHHSSICGITHRNDNPTIKEVFKWVYGPILEKSLQVNYKPLSPFRISLTFTHEDNDEEVEFINELSDSRPGRRRKRRKLQHNPVEGALTGPAVKKALAELTTTDLLKKYVDCPPKSPQSPSRLSEITCSHESIYVAGRYNKYSRVLSQTPWIIDDVRHGDSSVEEKICDRIKPKLKADDHKFASAGREDVDVQMLGIGRPFLVEFINPRVTRLSTSLFSGLQQEINSSSTDVAVRDLQQVTKEQSLVLKDAETNKTKTYCALVWTEKQVTRQQLEKLEERLDLKIFQKTPLRVLHRRPLAVRERLIYTMKPQWIDCHHFILRLKTQAGTYIKEFVHGDFGRTKPNLGNLLNMDADILQLDVESVDVDWPPRREESGTKDDDCTPRSSPCGLSKATSTAERV